MNRKRRKIAIAVVLAVLLFAGAKFAVGLARFSNIEKQFPSVQIGQSQSAVLAKLGRPNYYEGKCGVIHFPEKNCATEYVYSHPFAPWAPDYYIVDFSPEARVIEADHWTSP